MKEIMTRKLRKGFFAFLMLLGGVMVFPLSIEAEEATVNDVTWEYDVLDDSSGVEIKPQEGGISDSLRGKVVIPDEIGGYTVVKIKSSAFYWNESITQVTIPDSVKVIGEGAFQGCTSLKTVIFNPQTMETIESYAFSECEKLENITLPANSKYTIISENLFSSCKKLSAVAIPSQVYKIDNSAFSYSGIQSLTIPNTITTMGESIAYECEKLVDVTLPVNNSITQIPKQMFYGCKMLKSVMIPSGYTAVGEKAFAESAVVGLCIPQTVTDIDTGAFYNCSGLQMIQFTCTSVPSFNGDSHFSYTPETLKIIVPQGMDAVYKTAMVDADNTFGIPLNAEFTGSTVQITVIPVLSGEITVSGVLYENQPLSGLTLSGTFLNALDNTTVTGSLSWDNPAKTYSKGYIGESLKWNFVPDASYGSGAMSISGFYAYSNYVEGSPAASSAPGTAAGTGTGTTNTTIVVQSPKNEASTVVTTLKKPSKPVIKSVKKKGKKKAVVSWKKAISGASGYQIAVSSKKNKGFKVKLTLKKPLAKSGVIGGIKKGKTYYIKVRAFTNINGVRIYSEYSKIKKLKA